MEKFFWGFLREGGVEEEGVGGEWEVGVWTRSRVCPIFRFWIHSAGEYRNFYIFSEDIMILPQLAVWIASAYGLAMTGNGARFLSSLRGRRPKQLRPL